MATLFCGILKAKQCMWSLHVSLGTSIMMLGEELEGQGPLFSFIIDHFDNLLMPT